MVIYVPFKSHRFNISFPVFSHQPVVNLTFLRPISYFISKLDSTVQEKLNNTKKQKNRGENFLQWFKKH